VGLRDQALGVYVGLVCLAGLTAAALVPSPGLWEQPGTALLVAILAAVAGARPVRIPSLRVELVATHPFVLCALAALGGHAAVAAAIAGVLGATVARGWQQRWVRLVFNLGSVTFTTAAAWWTYVGVGGRTEGDLLARLWPLMAATTAYFITNTGLVTTAVSLEKRQRFLRVWCDSFQWTAISYAFGLTLASGLLLVLETFGVWALALGIPPALLLGSFYRTHKERLEEKLQRIQDVEKLNAELERTVRELQAALADVERGRQKLQREITEREQTEEALRHSEEQLRQSQKMEAIGRLAGGIAHDFNNLLTAIGGYTDLILAQPTDATLHGHAEEIKKASDRAASLTRQLLAFSRRQMLEPRIVDMNAIVENMDKMLRRLIGADIDLAFERCPDLGMVRADPGQMEQVLLNLAVNARDAMPEGGQLFLETANVTAGDPIRHPEMPDGDYVRLTLRDTGCGMDEMTQSRIFEPFFTTKAEGKGTGLGLSMVYGIVKQSGGWIWVTSALGHGTAFDIYLPRVHGTREAAEQRRPAPALTQGTETVLLVEDEDQVRDLAREVLQMNGYTVLEAPHGAEAIRICERYDDEIHLVLTDMIMPHMNGRELFERLIEQRPELKVLYMSGYTDQAVIGEGLLDEGAAYLQKPFSLDGLARKIREVLELTPQPVH
jgi:signal transduction histidine kinase/ActR/RegA family two-component response regulator